MPPAKKRIAASPRQKAQQSIAVRGARQNNLKGLDLEIPLGKLTVVTGPSGSGKSSLAFQTLYAEGQRRYVETFSPYVRQFFDRMDKPADLSKIPQFVCSAMESALERAIAAYRESARHHASQCESHSVR